MCRRILTCDLVVDPARNRHAQDGRLTGDRRILSRIAILDAVGGELGGSSKRLRQRFIALPGEFQEALKIVRLGKLHLPPHQERFERFLGRLLRMKGHRLSEGALRTCQLLTDEQIRGGLLEPLPGKISRHVFGRLHR